MTYTETDLVASVERLTGAHLTGTQPAALTREQWDQIDQFHVGGPEAVDRMLSGLRLAPGMTALDVGSGFGGPARQIARTTGCDVVGVDITHAYAEAARTLTQAAGLADRIRFVCTDIAAFDGAGLSGAGMPGAAFDAAYTMHVQMNVADKRAYFTEIARRLRPQAPFAVFEVCAADHASSDLPLPLPWSLDGTDSFLATGEQLRGTIESSGFGLIEWVDETAWARAWFDGIGARIAAGGPQPVLPALLEDGFTRMLNFAAALEAGSLSVHRGLFVAAS